MEFNHISIMLDECIDALNIKKDGIYIDATLGGAGHSYHIASKLDNGKLICLDRDDMALDNAKIRLKDFLGKVILIKSDFRNIDFAIKSAGFEKVDGILFDLGVSSPQLDNANRGFSYMKDAKLDMRMDNSQKISAYDIINFYKSDELVDIIFKYGEEKYARRIVKSIIKHRDIKPIETTLEFVEIIKYALPNEALRDKGHPAKRTFQAIRIAVNDELSAISEAMEKSIKLLDENGRLAVISFHSLEDRIVKLAMKENTIDCICPKEFPVCICDAYASVRLIKRKGIVPTKNEIDKNSRARSAKLRICEKMEQINE